ncbi:MAG TPA: hypothetical protein VF509_04960 [Sphingobium sp.]
MTEPAAAIGIKEVGSWLLSGTALVVTVIWNIHNRRYTDRKSGEVRTATFAYAAWKDLRDPVLARLREFEAKGHELQALTVGTDAQEALIQKVHSIGYSLTIAFLALEKDLTRVRSTEVSEEVWLPLANGLMIAGETDWDRINTAIHDAAAAPTADECRTLLKGVDPLILSIGMGINANIAVENASHDPNKI